MLGSNNETTVGGQDLSGDEGCLFRCEEGHRVGDVGGGGQAAQRGLLWQLLQKNLSQGLGPGRYR